MQGYLDGLQLVLALANSTKSSITTPTSPSPAPALILTLRSQPNDMVLQPLFASLIEQFDCSRTGHLHITGDLLPRAVFQNTLATLPTQKITLVATDPHDLLKIMNDNPSLTQVAPVFRSGKGKAKPPPRKPHYFPGLKTLELSMVDFGVDGTRVKLLISALKRRQRGSRLHRLEIDEASNFREWDKKEIKEALPKLDLEWDGLELDSEEEDEDEFYGDDY